MGFGSWKVVVRRVLGDGGGEEGCWVVGGGFQTR